MSNESQHNEFEYMLLSRYKQDLDYFFGWGGRNEKHLYFLDFKEHIKQTRKLWDSLNVKPDWFLESDLDSYEALYITESPATEAEKEYLRYIEGK